MRITERALRNLVAGDLSLAMLELADLLEENAEEMGALEDYTQIKHVMAKLS